MSLVIPDVSEFQSVDFSAFSGPIIVRAHNGRRGDYHWIQHATGACHQPWWAAYQYLPANVDATTAAQGFLAVLDGFRPNATILDLEEGDGDQSQRQHDWLTVMASDPAKDWTYSGDYFARSHGLTVDWIAAYQSREPTAAHQLWQFTDAHDFPGIGTCDASVFNGTLEDLIALTNPPQQPLQQQSEDDKVYILIKGDQQPQWWLTDYLTKRYVFTPDEATSAINDISIIGGHVIHDNGQPYVRPQAYVDHIPVVKS